MKKEDKERNNQFVDSHGVTNDVGESQISKYHSGKEGKAGHGFAAEDANALADKFKGKRVEKVGANNAKNGPDRISSGERIQTKYCKTARETVNAAFGDGVYKYKLRNGRPMKLEVPYDQYEEAIQYMKKKIINGEVTGVKNPDHAYKMIKRGRVTYNQSVSIAKTGKVEGILYDAANGAVTCVMSAGISATITFLRDKQKGVKTSQALKHAGKQAVKSGGATAVTQIAVGQTERIILSQAAKSASKKAVEEGSKKISNSILTSIAKSTARTNVVTSAVTTIITSAPDIRRACKGEMKWSECGENVAVNNGSVAAGIACGAKGAALGSFAGPPGTVIGGLAGSVIGSVAASAAGKKAISAVKNFFGKKR